MTTETRTVRVTLADNRVFEFDVVTTTRDGDIMSIPFANSAVAKAAEMASAIGRGGYAHNNGTNFEFIPAAQIKSVAILSGCPPTDTPDRTV